MNFGKNDMFILVGSFMVIVFMTLVFPALGLTDDGANQNNVPELDLQKNQLELVGDRPEFPRSPTSGELRYTPSGAYDNQAVLERKNDGEYAVFVETFCFDNDIEDCRAQVSIFDGDYNNLEYHQITESDFQNRSVVTVSNQDNSSDTWEVQFEFIEVNNWGTENVDYVISWEIVEKPGSGGWIGDVPILGGIYSSANELASILGWGITVFFWFCTWIVELALNAISVIVTGVLFGFNLISFMLTNYNGMLSQVTGIASFILLIPVVLLSVELLKLGFIFVKLLPTT